MGDDRRTALAPLNTADVRSESAQKGQESAVVDMCDHIKKLKQVSGTAKSLIALLGDQIQVLSRSIPVRRGFEIVCGRFYPIVLALSELHRRQRN
jgi:hypothetical protein